MTDPAAPRVCHYPPYVSSSGQEAVELAASAGLILDPWQKFVLRHSLGEREDGRWSAYQVGLIVGRQQGKGSVLEARELAGLVLFNERMIIHTAHELSTSMIHFARLKVLFESNPDLDKLVSKMREGNGKESIVMRNGCELYVKARSKGGGRGYSGDLVVWDEGYALTAPQVSATAPTMLARDNAQLWVTSSPPLDAVSGEVLMGLRERGESGTEARMAWFDYGLPGTLDRLDQVDLEDRRNWSAALPAFRSGRVREENVLELRKILTTDEEFAREALGIWPPGLGATFKVISPDDWNGIADELSEIEDLFSLAAAVSVDRSRAAIAAVGRRPDGLLHMEITSTPLRSDNRNGTAWVPGRTAAICAKRTPINVVMDTFGPTGSLIPDVERELEDALQGGAPEVLKLGMGDVSRAFGMFYDRVAGPDRAGRTLRHINQPELTAAVANAATRALGDGMTWDRRSATADITPLVACTHALYGWITRSDEFGSFNIY